MRAGQNCRRCRHYRPYVEGRRPRRRGRRHFGSRAERSAPPFPGATMDRRLPAARSLRSSMDGMEHDETGPDFETLEQAIRRHVVDAVKLARGNQRRTAALLDVSRWRLARLVKRFELADLVTALRRERQPASPVLDVPPPSHVSPADHN